MTATIDEFDLDVRIGIAPPQAPTGPVANNSLVDSGCAACGTTVASPVEKKRPGRPAAIGRQRRERQP